MPAARLRRRARHPHRCAERERCLGYPSANYHSLALLAACRLLLQRCPSCAASRRVYCPALTISHTHTLEQKHGSSIAPTMRPIPSPAAAAARSHSATGKLLQVKYYTIYNRMHFRQCLARLIQLTSAVKIWMRQAQRLPFTHASCRGYHHQLELERRSHSSSSRCWGYLSLFLK